MCVSVCVPVCVCVCVWVWVCVGGGGGGGVCLCLCVCYQDWDEMSGLRNTALSEAITIDNSSRKQYYQDDPNPIITLWIKLYQITFWPITS